MNLGFISIDVYDWRRGNAFIAVPYIGNVHVFCRPFGAVIEFGASFGRWRRSSPLTRASMTVRIVFDEIDRLDSLDGGTP